MGFFFLKLVFNTPGRLIPQELNRAIFQIFSNFMNSIQNLTGHLEKLVSSKTVEKS